MQHKTLPALTSPEYVGIVRRLLAAMTQAGYEHLLYQIDDGPVEHNWRNREHEVALVDGQLIYTRGTRRVLQATVDSPQRAADLLVALDILPAELSSAYKAGRTATIDAIARVMCPLIGDHEHDHEMCRDVVDEVAEQSGGAR